MKGVNKMIMENIMENMTVKLRDMSVPTEKKRVITYNSSGDKAVYHNKEVWKITNNFYVGEVEGSDYNKWCTIYAIYGDNVGFIIDYVNADYSVEETLNLINRSNIGTLDLYIETIDRRINEGNWINSIEMEFIKTIKPKLIPGVEKARAAHKARLEAERQAREEERIAERKAEMEKDNAEAMEIVNAAIAKIKSGGDIINEYFTLWIDLENHKEYSTFTYLFDKYGIKVPIKTRGFILNSLNTVRIDKDNGVSYNYYRKGKSQGSSKIYELIFELVGKIRNESEE